MKVLVLIPHFIAMKAFGFLAYSATAVSPPALVSSSCDFGETYQFQKTECVVELVNSTSSPIRVLSVKSTEPGDAADQSSLVIPARAQAYLKVSVSPTNVLGYTKRYFELRTDQKSEGVRYAEAKGIVLSALDEAKPSLDFGVVDLVADALPSKEITLSSKEVENFRVERIISKPDYLDVVILPDGRSLRASLKKSAPWGIHNSDVIKVAINTPSQPQAWVAVKADIHGEVVPDSNPYALGLMRKGNRNYALIPLRSRSSKDFRVGSVEVSRANAKAQVVECIPAAKGCRMLKIKVSDQQAHAQVGGLVTVAMPDFDQVLSLYFWGMLVEKSTRVLDFEEEMKKQDASVAAASGDKSALETGTPKAALDISKAIKTEVSKASAPPPPGRGPLLTWSVANQSLIYGFVVYRSSSADGRGVKVSEKTIPVTGGPDETSTYQWRDVSAVPGNKYWYSIDVIRKNGIKQQLSGPQGVVAK